MQYFFRLLCCFLLLPIAQLVYGQTDQEVKAYGDSLYRDIQQLPAHAEKGKALLELSFFWGDYDTAQAFAYIEEAQPFLTKLKNPAMSQGMTFFYTASAYFDADPVKAKMYYMRAEQEFKQLETEDAIRYRIRLWSSYGALRQRDGEAKDYVDALINRVIPLASQIRDTALLGNNYQNVAMALMNMQDYQHANDYYAKAIEMLSIPSGSDEHRLTAYTNAARNAVFQQQLSLAKDYLNEASKVFERIPLSTYGPMYHTVYGSYWKKKKQWDKAFEQFELGLARARALKSESLIATVRFDQYEAYRQAGRFNEARTALLEVVPYVEKSAIWRNKRQLYYNLAELERDLGNFESATAWYERYAAAVDTMAADASEERILDLERKYQTAEKEKELLRTREVNQQQQLSLIRSQNWMVILGLCCLLLVLLGVIGYLGLRSRKRMQQQQERLQIFRAMAKGEEQERSRVARDLHDGLGGLLAGIKLKLSAMVSRLPAASGTDAVRPLQEPLQQLINELDNSVDEVRRVARNMMPESLRTLGLEAALSDLCKNAEHAHLRIHFNATNLDNSYDTRLLLAVYRIVQELITNAIKHSEASQLWVQCSQQASFIHLSVEDNGKGFTPAADRSLAKGMGWQNIYNRVDMLQGTISLDAALGEGVSVHIKLPVS